MADGVIMLMSSEEKEAADDVRDSELVGSFIMADSEEEGAGVGGIITGYAPVINAQTIKIQTAHHVCTDALRSIPVTPN